MKLRFKSIYVFEVQVEAISHFAVEEQASAETKICVWVCRLTVEGHVQPGEAAVLRGAGEAEPTAFGALPRLQIQAPTKTHMHRGGPKTTGGRVQSDDEEPQTGAEINLHAQVGHCREQQEFMRGDK